MPAYAVVQGLIKQMLSKPEELLKTLTIILERHPAVVNSHYLRTGSSLLQMVRRTATSPRCSSEP